MLVHYHGQTWNLSVFARSMDVSFKQRTSRHCASSWMYNEPGSLSLSEADFVPGRGGEFNPATSIQG